jgi:hypothetical protein
MDLLLQDDLQQDRRLHLLNKLSSFMMVKTRQMRYLTACKDDIVFNVLGIGH